MAVPSNYSFIRYLAAKKSLDDRSLNREVWRAFAEALADRAGRSPGDPTQPLRILEAGCGIGTMLERAFEWGLFGSGQAASRNLHYTAVDSDPQNILQAGFRLRQWAQAKGYPHWDVPLGTLNPANEPASSRSYGLQIDRHDQCVEVYLTPADILEFAAHPQNQGCWDVLIAHAFLDLLDLPTALPALLRLLRPGGLLYFTLNFDGVTLFEPVLDPELDELIQALYHQNMDKRLTGGRPSGDSRSGRHLFSHLLRYGAQILAAGASDWVVFPREGRYPDDEAYFLHIILHTIEGALRLNPALDPQSFASWINARHSQVEHGELVYIAHQIDFFGRLP